MKVKDLIKNLDVSDMDKEIIVLKDDYFFIENGRPGKLEIQAKVNEKNDFFERS